METHFQNDHRESYINKFHDVSLASLTNTKVEKYQFLISSHIYMEYNLSTCYHDYENKFINICLRYQDY